MRILLLVFAILVCVSHAFTVPSRTPVKTTARGSVSQSTSYTLSYPVMIEHSLDRSTYTGKISGYLNFVDGIPALRLEPDHYTWTSDEKDTLKDLLASNDMYEVRVTLSAPRQSAVAQAHATVFIPACALIASNFRESLAFNIPKPLDGIIAPPSDILAGLTYESHITVSRRSVRCQDEVQRASHTVFKPLTVSSSVTLAKPSQQPLPNRGPVMNAIRSARMGEVQNMENEKRKANDNQGENGDNTSPQKEEEEEEKGFLAKYWMYIMPLVIAAVMGGGGEQQQGNNAQSPAPPKSDGSSDRPQGGQGKDQERRNKFTNNNGRQS